jgi:phosphate transport system substrate-binding protein
MFAFFDWCYRHGGDAAAKLNYVAIPESVYTLVEGTWKSDVRAGGAFVWP